MASKFTITAELNLQTKNLNQVVGNLKKQFAGANLNIKIKDLAQAQAQIQKIGTTAKQSSKSFGDFANGIVSATRRFTALTAATATFVGLARAIKSGVGEAITFEREVVKIAQATGQTKAQLAGLTKEITNVSTSLGASSQELIVAARNLTQAGIAADKVRGALRVLAQTELAATFDSIADTTEGAIALLNQFGREAQRAGTEVQFLEKSLSAINQVSKDYAVESSDLITAIRTTGSAFESAGGNLDELLALFTSIRSTTRESAESISTGLRTIFTRMQRVDTIENLKKMGIELQDVEGKFVGPLEATKRLSNALNAIDPRDFRFNLIVEQLGGFRQVSKVIPLIQQFNVSQRALNTAQQSSSSLAKDAATAQQSLAVQIDRVKEEFKALIRELTETSTFKTMVSDALSLASAMIKVASSIKPIIPLLASVAAIKLGQAFVPAIKQVTGMGMMRKAQGGQIHHFASGGLVPGVGNSDTVPAMLSPGEFVIRKSSVNSLGIENLAKMNKHGIGGKETGASFRKKYMEDDSSSSLAKFQASGAKEGAAERAFLKSGLTQFDKEFGAVFLRPNDIEEDIQGSVSLKAILDRYAARRGTSVEKLGSAGKYIKQGLGKDSINFNIKSTSIDSKFKDKFQESLFGDLIKLVDNNADSLMRDAGVPVEGLNEGATYKLLKASNLDQTLGNIFEATLKTASGKFADTADTGAGNQPFDFPTGLGSRFDKILTKPIGSIPTDAKTTFTDKSITSLINKARDQIAQDAIEAYAKNGGLEEFFKLSGGVDTLKSNAMFKALSGKDESLEDFAKRYGYSTTGKTSNTKFQKVATGGSIASLTDIPWMSKGGETDTVPAMLTPGEFVINKASAQKIGYSALDKMNKVGKFAKGGAVNVKHFATGGMTSDDETSINNFIRKLDEAGVGLQKLAEVKDILYAVANESEHLVGAMKSVERIIQSNPSQKNEQFSSLQTQRILNAGIQGGVKNPSQGRESRVNAQIIKEQENKLKQEKKNTKEAEQNNKKLGDSTKKVNENLVLFGSLAASTAIQMSGLNDAAKEGLSAFTSTFGAIYSLGQSLAGLSASMIAAKAATLAQASAEASNTAATVADTATTVASTATAAAAAKSGMLGKVAGWILTLGKSVLKVVPILGAVATAFAVFQGVTSFNNRLIQEANDKFKSLNDKLSDTTTKDVKVTKEAYVSQAKQASASGQRGFFGATANLVTLGFSNSRKSYENTETSKEAGKLASTLYDATVAVNDFKAKMTDASNVDFAKGVSSVNKATNDTSRSIENMRSYIAKNPEMYDANKEVITASMDRLKDFNKQQEALLGVIKERATKSIAETGGILTAESKKLIQSGIDTARSEALTRATATYNRPEFKNLTNEQRQGAVKAEQETAASSFVLAMNKANQQVIQSQLAISAENAARENLLGSMTKQLALTEAINSAQENIENFNRGIQNISAIGGKGEITSLLPDSEKIKAGRRGAIQSALSLAETRVGGPATEGLRQSTNAAMAVQEVAGEIFKRLPAFSIAEGGINKGQPQDFVKNELTKALQQRGIQGSQLPAEIAREVEGVLKSKDNPTQQAGPEEIEKLTKSTESIVESVYARVAAFNELMKQEEDSRRQSIGRINELFMEEIDLRSKGVDTEIEQLNFAKSVAKNPQQEERINAQIIAKEKEKRVFEVGGNAAIAGNPEAIYNEAKKAQDDARKAVQSGNIEEAMNLADKSKVLTNALQKLTEKSNELVIAESKVIQIQNQRLAAEAANQEVALGSDEQIMQTLQAEQFVQMFTGNKKFRKMIETTGLNEAERTGLSQYLGGNRKDLKIGRGGETGGQLLETLGGINRNVLSRMRGGARLLTEGAADVSAKEEQEGMSNVKKLNETQNQANQKLIQLNQNTRQQIKQQEQARPDVAIQVNQKLTEEERKRNVQGKELDKSIQALGGNVEALSKQSIGNLITQLGSLKDAETDLKKTIDLNNQILAKANNLKIVDGEIKSTGGPIYAANGKYVNFKPQGTDTVPAMLSPGEFVIRKSAVDKVGADKLHAINSGNYKAFGGYPTWMDRSSNWMDNIFYNTAAGMANNWYDYATAPDRAFGQFSNYMYNSFNDTAFGMIDAFNQTAMNGFAGVGSFSPLNMQFSNNMPMSIGLPFSSGGVAYLASGGGRRTRVADLKRKKDAENQKKIAEALAKQKKEIEDKLNAADNESVKTTTEVKRKDTTIIQGTNDPAMGMFYGFDRFGRPSPMVRQPMAKIGPDRRGQAIARAKERSLDKREAAKKRSALGDFSIGPDPNRDTRSDYQKQLDAEKNKKQKEAARIEIEASKWRDQVQAKAKAAGEKSPKNLIMEEVRNKAAAQIAAQKAEEAKKIPTPPVVDDLAIKNQAIDKERDEKIAKIEAETAARNAAREARKKEEMERFNPPKTNTPPNPKEEEGFSWIEAREKHLEKTREHETPEAKREIQRIQDLPGATSARTRQAEKAQKEWEESQNIQSPKKILEDSQREAIKNKRESDEANRRAMEEWDKANRRAMEGRGVVPPRYVSGGIVPSTGFAKGGIKNIGSTDKIPAMLTPGEFVMNERAVKKYGTHAMNKLNNGQMQGFATGGIVGGVTYAAGGGAIGGGPAVDMSSINNAINSAFATGSKYIQDALGNNPLTESLNQFSNNIQSFVDKLTNINMTHTVNLQGSVTVAGLNVNEINDVITKNIGNLIKEKIQDYMSNTNKQWKPG